MTSLGSRIRQLLKKKKNSVFTEFNQNNQNSVITPEKWAGQIRACSVNINLGSVYLYHLEK
jgi:hypothetical protein